MIFFCFWSRYLVEKENKNKCVLPSICTFVVYIYETVA